MHQQPLHDPQDLNDCHEDAARIVSLKSVRLLCTFKVTTVLPMHEPRSKFA